MGFCSLLLEAFVGTHGGEPHRVAAAPRVFDINARNQILTLSLCFVLAVTMSPDPQRGAVAPGAFTIRHGICDQTLPAGRRSVSSQATQVGKGSS